MVYVETSDILLGQRCLEFGDDCSCSLDFEAIMGALKALRGEAGT